MGDLVELTTWPSQRNIFYKITSNGLAFEVKVNNMGAAIGLSRRPGGMFPGHNTSCDVWVVIGCSHHSWIRRENDSGKSCRTPNIVNSQNYNQFWLVWRNGCIQLGQGHEKTPVLSYPNTLDLKYVTFSTAKSTSSFGNYNERHAAHWRFYLPPIIEKPISKKITGGDLQWINAANQLPDGALIGGYEKETLYIIRAPFRGSVTPGKFVPSEGVGYISWGGDAHEKNEFQVLCGFDCIWVPTNDSKVPVNAVEGGYSEDRREKLYVGRASVNGCLIPGKVQPSHRVCYVAYNGKEVAHKKYEILVSGEIDARCANKLFIDHIEVESAPESESDDDVRNDEPLDMYEEMGEEEENEENGDIAQYPF